MIEPWTPPPRIFERQTVFIVGGGPSLRGFDWNRLAGKRVIVCNVGGYMVPFADALVFSDSRFAQRHRKLISEFRGLLVSTSERAAASMPDRVKLVVPTLHEVVKPGPSSGHLGAWLAIQAGAKRVVLLGMDGATLRDGRAHYHDLYSEPLSDWGCNRLVGGWLGWNVAAELVGCEIINASRMSAIPEFRKVDIDSILGDRVI